jgi:3-isopropylmalate/(R)-2-methylmalate dehydratase large subunit
VAHAQSDDAAKFDAVVTIDASQLTPQVTWGTSPEMVLSIDERVPDPDRSAIPRAAKEWNGRSRTWG